jgi:fluoroquinolone transport system permease protein
VRRREGKGTVRTLRYFAALAPIDRRSVMRDPLLRWTVLLPVLLALGLRWGGPPLVEQLGQTIGYALTPHYTPLLGVALLMMVPMLVGTVVGFLLLDQRDDDTLTALLVTPMPLAAYLTYRLGLPVLLSTAVAAALLPLAGLGGAHWIGLLVAAAAAAPLAPLFALALAAFAANKVQGFALMKAFNVLSIPPLVAYFVGAQWQWAFYWAPTYWPAKVYWAVLADDGPDVLRYLAAGLALQAGCVWLLLRLYRRRLNG